MDLQADEAKIHEDPHVTAVFERQAASADPTTSQGQLFSDAYPTYADTDRITAVCKGGHAHVRPRTSRLLRFAVAVVALAVVGAAVVLGLVEAGVIDKSSTGGAHASTAGSVSAHHSAHSTTPKAQVATQVSTGPQTATYRVDIAAYSVTVTTSTGRSWVSIGGAGKKPSFAGILQPNSSQKE